MPALFYLHQHYRYAILIVSMETKPKIQVTKLPGKQVARVADLSLWAQNPKDVESADYARLRAQYELGEHSPLLITVHGEVLGGNTRLRLYKELGVENAKVVVVDFKQEGDTVSAYVDGTKATKQFSSVEQAKLEYALSHNGQIGRYNREALAELALDYAIDTEIYEVATYVQPVEMVISALSPSEEVSRDADVSSVGTDKVDSYMNGAIKQIVLVFDNEQYLDVLDRLDAVRDPEEDNTSLFLRLLSAYENGSRT